MKLKREIPQAPPNKDQIAFWSYNGCYYVFIARSQLIDCFKIVNESHITTMEPLRVPLPNYTFQFFRTCVDGVVAIVTSENKSHVIRLVPNQATLVRSYDLLVRDYQHDGAKCFLLVGDTFYAHKTEQSNPVNLMKVGQTARLLQTGDKVYLADGMQLIFMTEYTRTPLTFPEPVQDICWVREQEALYILSGKSSVSRVVQVFVEFLMSMQNGSLDQVLAVCGQPIFRMAEKLLIYDATKKTLVAKSKARYGVLRCFGMQHNTLVVTPDGDLHIVDTLANSTILRVRPGYQEIQTARLVNNKLLAVDQLEGKALLANPLTGLAQRFDLLIGRVSLEANTRFLVQVNHQMIKIQDTVENFNYDIQVPSEAAYVSFNDYGFGDIVAINKSHFSVLRYELATQKVIGTRSFEMALSSAVMTRTGAYLIEQKKNIFFISFKAADPPKLVGKLPQIDLAASYGDLLLATCAQYAVLFNQFRALEYFDLKTKVNSMSITGADAVVSQKNVVSKINIFEWRPDEITKVQTEAIGDVWLSDNGKELYILSKEGLHVYE